MKKIKIIPVTVIILCLLFVLNGCCNMSDDKNLKDNLLNNYNNLLKTFSKFALNDDISLKGERTFGTDEYTGSYKADYKEFNGKEYIFGGTALEREDGSELRLTYELEITSGYAKLYHLAGGEEHIIAEESAEGVYNFTLNPCDNYIIFEGEDFIGSLILKSE